MNSSTKVINVIYKKEKKKNKRTIPFDLVDVIARALALYLTFSQQF